MLHHEREYFVSRIRAGFYIVSYDKFRLKVVSPGLEEDFYINQAFMDGYEDAFRQDLMTKQEMLLVTRGDSLLEMNQA